MIALHTAVQQLRSMGCDPVRHRECLSWGDYPTCRRLFEEAFRRVDNSVVEFKFLPEYEHVVRWMMNTKGRGLLLRGDCGRGKSTILTGVIPLLLHLHEGVAVRAIHSERLLDPCRVTWVTEKRDVTNLDYLMNTRFPIIDEMGVEQLANNYGLRFDPIPQVLNTAEQRLRHTFLSTNLTLHDLLRRYDQRSLDRMLHLCTLVEFRGESLR